MPHPMQSSSEIHAVFVSGVTSMQSLPIFTTGHMRLHSCRHFFGLHCASARARARARERESAKARAKKRKSETRRA